MIMFTEKTGSKRAPAKVYKYPYTIVCPHLLNGGNISGQCYWPVGPPVFLGPPSLFIVRCCRLCGVGRLGEIGVELAQVGW